MSTNKTANLRLHSWIATDPFKRDEINDNFAAIDAAFGEAVSPATVAANSAAIARNAENISQNAASIALLTSSLAAANAAMPKVAAGQYAGNGGTQTVSVGFTPKAVLLTAESTVSTNFSALLVRGVAVYASVNAGVAAQIVDGGFQVIRRTHYDGSQLYPELNMSGTMYSYLAVG